MIRRGCRLSTGKHKQGQPVAAERRRFSRHGRRAWQIGRISNVPLDPAYVAALKADPRFAHVVRALERKGPEKKHENIRRSRMDENRTGKRS